MKKNILLYLISLIILPCIFFSCSKDDEITLEEKAMSIIVGEWTGIPAFDSRGEYIMFECTYFHKDGRADWYEEKFYKDAEGNYEKEPRDYVFNCAGTWEYIPIDETNGFLVITTPFESNTNKVTFEFDKRYDQLIMYFNNNEREYIIKDGVNITLNF